MRKTLWLLYQPYKFLILMPLAGLLTLIFGFFALPFVFIFGPKTASFLSGVLWARLLCYLTPITVKVQGRENIHKKQSYVIIANHLSLYDIFVLYGWIGIDFRWIMKKELRNVPGLGIACEKIGHIYVDRSSPTSALETIRQTKLKVREGTSIIVFPEGTRSANGEMGEFKKGAFKIAFDLNLPILPITLTGTDTILPNHSLNLFPGRANIKIHPPVPLENYSWENVTKLMEDVRLIIKDRS